MKHVKEPLFDKRKGAILLIGNYVPDTDISPDFSINIGTEVDVKFQGENIGIKVKNKISETEFVGQIISYSNAELRNKDISIGTEVKLFRDNVVAIVVK